jgi:hypothetical protein
VFKFHDKYWVYLCTAQGSRTAPISWGRIAGVLCRLTQGAFDPAELRVNMFVDDPILSLRGGAQMRRFNAALFILLWRTLGFPLQFVKAMLGPKVTWIGAELALVPLGVQARAKKDILDDLTADMDAIEASNCPTKKLVRSFAGRCSHVSTLIPVWKPFLAELWAALSSEPGRAPAGCIWLRQIKSTIFWMRAFIRGRHGTVTRLFKLDAYMNLGPQVQIVTDASPWGLGGYLVYNGRIKAFFSSKLTKDDFDRFGHEQGNSHGQQTWEALGMLVALRLWAQEWLSGRVRLRVRGDSITMLTTVLHMNTGSGSTLALIAREVALDIAESAYSPDIGSHLPGDANTTADELSRRDDPRAGPWQLPPELQGAAEAEPPARDSAYYRTLAPR